MVHTWVSAEFIHFTLMYTTDHIFPFLPNKHLVNQYVEPTIPHKLRNGTNPLLSNTHVLFCSVLYERQLDMLKQRH